MKSRDAQKQLGVFFQLRNALPIHSEQNPNTSICVQRARGTRVKSLQTQRITLFLIADGNKSMSQLMQERPNSVLQLLSSVLKLVRK